MRNLDFYFHLTVMKQYPHFPYQNGVKENEKQLVKTEILKKSQSLITKYESVQVSMENYLSYQVPDLE